MKRNLSNDGFSVIVLLLFIIIAGVIIGTGLFVYHAQKNVSNTYTSTTKISNNSSPKFTVLTKEITSKGIVKVANPAQNWYLYTSPSNKYTMRIPDGWEITQNGTDPWSPLVAYPYLNPTLAIRPGVKATVTIHGFGKDGNPTFDASWYDFSVSSEDAQSFLESINNSSTLKNEGSFKTSSGSTVNKYYMYVTQPSQNISQPEQGTYYEYIIKNSSGFVYIFNFYPPGSTDYHLNVEDAIKTIQLES